MRPFFASALALGLIALSSVAVAQGQGPTDQGQAQGQGEAPQGETPPAPKGDMGGYSYKDKPAARAASGRKGRALRRHGPVVNLPGFEQLPDGGSRLFVSLSSTVPVEERKAKGSITYILKGASARVWNNTRALVTVHFNTPVSRARLVPHGNDLHFVVDLRAAATPTWKMTEAQDKTSVLQIDFPKGDFAAADSGEVPVAEDGADAAPAPKAGRKKGGGKSAPAAKPAGPTP